MLRIRYQTFYFYFTSYSVLIYFLYLVTSPIAKVVSAGSGVGRRPNEGSRILRQSPARASVVSKKKADALPRSYAHWLLAGGGVTGALAARSSQQNFFAGPSYANLPNLSGSTRQARPLRQHSSSHSTSISYDSGDVVGLEWEDVDNDAQPAYE